MLIKKIITILYLCFSFLIQAQESTIQMKKINYSENWGNGKNPLIPCLDISFYSPKKGTSKIVIMTMNSTVVNSFTVENIEDYHTVPYDISFSKKGKSNYLQKNKRRLIEAENGKTYLPKGKYIVEISGNSTTQKTTFEIK